MATIYNSFSVGADVLRKVSVWGHRGGLTQFYREVQSPMSPVQALGSAKSPLPLCHPSKKYASQRVLSQMEDLLPVGLFALMLAGAGASVLPLFLQMCRKI